jgi:UDP-glucose 4-epimerase
VNILVSGSSGFIASHLISKLKELGHKVIGMDIKGKSSLDICNIGDVIIAMRNVDVVVHLAAYTEVQDSIEFPMRYYDNNLTGLMNMLDIASSKKIKRFIFASSAAADNPQSPYGVSKLCGEHWCGIFQKCYGLSTVSLRFFNVYGKGTDKGVIPTWIKAIKNGERPVIYGGNQVRDFIYVKDVVDAIIYAMESQEVGTFEVGTGRGIAIFDLAQDILEVMGSDLKIIPDEKKSGEIEISMAGMGELSGLGYKAKYTLKQGLKEMIK